MSIRPSSDKPLAEYYIQPWWVRDLIRLGSIGSNSDLAVLSPKDIKAMVSVVESLKEVLDKHVQS